MVGTEENLNINDEETHTEADLKEDSAANDKKDQPSKEE